MSSLRRLAPYLRRYRSRYALGLAAVAVTAALSLAAPWVLQRAIDDLGRGVTAAKLAFYGGVLLVLALVGGATRFLMRRIIIGVSRHVECDVRDDFVGHLSRLPLAFFQQRRTGDLMSRAMNDLESVRLMIGISVIDAGNTVIVFVVAIILMASIDFRLTLLALAPLPFVSVSVKLFGAAIYRRFQGVQAQLAEVTAVTQEGLGAARLVRAYGQEETQVQRFAAETRQYFARNRSLIRLQSAFYATMTFCLGVGAVLVLWIGGGDVVRGRMTLGEFVAFGAYQVMLGIPMIAFGSLTNTVQRGIAAWRRMVEVFDVDEAGGEAKTNDAKTNEAKTNEAKTSEAKTKLRPTRVPAAADVVRLPERLSVEFRALTFSYPGAAEPAVRDVSFRVEPGQVVALVGATGSGKSTLLSLLPRLHEPPRGTVFLGGIDVRDLPLDVLRRAIGFAPQEPFLFADTLAENIAFAPPAGYERRRWPRQQAREEPPSVEDVLSGGVDLRGTGTFHLHPDVAKALRRAAAIARLDSDVPDLPQGYDTPLGERGMNLSGGQRQRTALARALMLNPSVLVLDDALSAVDTKTEEEILGGLREEMRRRTSLIVSNRISTVRAADVILVLDEGRIVERGTHRQLVARGGAYAELQRKQMLREALADA